MVGSRGARNVVNLTKGQYAQTPFTEKMSHTTSFKRKMIRQNMEYTEIKALGKGIQKELLLLK